jgi:hypothetical protein
MEEQITAVEFLVKELNEKAIVGGTIDRFVMNNAIEQAKEMEKQQIINTCKDVDSTDFWVKYEGFEEYYNYKFKK